MSVLIKKARIVDPHSSQNGKVADILIEKGRIAAIRSSINKKAKRTVAIKNLHVSPGWCDTHANFRDPGFEYKEDIQSGMNAAAAGGFTAVAVMPSTLPCTDNKPQVEYVKKKAAGGMVDVHPVGALSVGCKGEDITEMFDMHQAGAVAFSDDDKPVQNAGLLERALLYSKAFDGLVMDFPYDLGIAHKGLVNESSSTAMLGLRQSPVLAEQVMVARDISLLEYTGGRLHFSTISSAESVRLIRQAKAKGLRLTCEVAAHQLALDDSHLTSYDSHFKVMPPLRTAEDIRELSRGLKDGTIDAICSDHRPEDIEQKNKEFDLAAFGIIGLETAYAASNSALRGKLETEEVIALLAVKPREILGIEVPVIKTGAMANITLFDPDKVWRFEEADIRSRSANTPFIGNEFVGKALGIYNKGQLWLHA